MWSDFKVMRAEQNRIVTVYDKGIHKWIAYIDNTPTTRIEGDTRSEATVRLIMIHQGIYPDDENPNK